MRFCQSLTIYNNNKDELFYRMIKIYLIENKTDSPPLQNYPITKTSNNTIKLLKDISETILKQKPMYSKKIA